MITLENLKEIQLFNRYNNDIYLEQLSTEPIQYKLCGKFNYMRYGKDENSENISFIDPEGGPFIEVGKFLLMGSEDLKLTKISIKETNNVEDFILTFGNIEEKEA